MNKHEDVGTKVFGGLSSNLNDNQGKLLDALLTPHVRLPETLGAKHRIVASYPAQVQETQLCTPHGRIVWNEAYRFQAKGPSYLDGTTDPGLGGGR